MWTMKINKQHNQGIGQNQEWIKAAGGDSQPAHSDFSVGRQDY